jgi:ATP/maltotriose-dependent transcriptional regulator MalT/DNA-binding SARP family transcriptional activator
MNRSKFLAPRPANILERERLISRLGAWDDKKLVIIHAQAGQGKSTLAAAYAASLPAPAIWYAMDTGDNDPAVFLSSLGQALQSALPDQFPKIPPLPRSRCGYRSSDPALCAWVRQLFDNLSRSCLIVFDDYHGTADTPALRSILKALFESTPASTRFLLLSRTRPELDIAKLRARRSVAELRGNDLKFSDAEVQELFGAVFGMPLAASEAAAVNRTAEGWPAGLVLLHGFFANLSGNDRLSALTGQPRTEFRAHIFDYLAEEVFSRLPPGLQDFLLHTAVTDRLTAPLMAALTGLPEQAPEGRPSVASRVRELATRNLFVSSIDADGSVIRYHALFREFLLKTFQAQRSSGEVRKHYALAARYFKAAGDPVRAVDLWLESGQADNAVREIESCAQHLVALGRTQTLLRWMHTLPKAASDRPWLLFARAVACRYIAPHEALKLYERAYKGFCRDRCVPGQMLSLSGIIEACFHTGGDFARMGRAAALAHALLGRSGRGSQEAKARLLLAIGMAWFFIGRLGQGSDALRQALELFRKQGNHFYHITSAIYLIPCALYQGDFPLAREAVKKGFEASDVIPEETGGRAALFLTRAMTSLFEGNFSEAQDCIDRCRDLADSHALESIGFLSLDIGGWLKIAQGDHRGAERLLAECKRKGEETSNAFFTASAAHLLAITHLFQGRLDRAKKESDAALAIQRRSGSRLFHGVYLIASGAIHMKLGKAAEAERELTAALRILRQCRAVQQEANAHLLLASMNLRRKREAAARKHLSAGFGIGEERGFTYYALLKQEELSSLAAAAIDRDIEPDYCRRLIAGPAAQQANPGVRIYCLGEFRVIRNGVVINDGEWKSRLAKTLVKLLAVRGGQKLTRDEVAETLWPDADAARKPLLLNSLLHRTRKVLEPDGPATRGDSCVIQNGGLLTLNPRKVWTDVHEFSTLHAAARQKRASRDQDTGKTLALYDQAFGLYQGDILPGDLFHDWAQGHREHIRKIHSEMLTHAASLTEAQEDRNRTFTYYERMFSLDPCNEMACRWLMAWHLAEGQRSDAVRLFERCQLALRKELDIEPDDQTRRLYRSIIGG